MRAHRRVAAMVMLALACAAGGARAQVSPGPLSEAHRDLDKPLACFECHVKGNPPGGMDARCLSCHGGLSATLARGRGFHATVKDRACAKCHPEHGGRAFALIEWTEGSPERFDHRRTGWALDGAHAKLECRKCHTPKLQRSDAAAKIRARDRSKSWLGLETGCASCHEDPHRGRLGAACTDCHDTRAWSPAPGFDHAKTDYPLTGLHAKVACAKCHGVSGAAGATAAAGGRPVMKWADLAHAECGDCHRDPHRKRFGETCTKCHTTRGFKIIDRDRFDHDRTRYRLEGAHADVACAKCHDPKTAWGEKPRFDRCDACHRDAHGGTATLAGAPADCAACHDVRAFKPSTYTAKAHARSAYPLEGAHADARCAGCHPKLPASDAAAKALGPARVRLRPAHERCTTCHVDPHGETFAAAAKRRADPAPAGGDPCRACHGLEAFRPSRVDVARHGRYAFRLDGAHGAIPCADCHADMRDRPRASTLRTAGAEHAVKAGSLTLAIAARACADCHRDPHAGQFAHRADKGACDGCHGVAAWKPASAFDHERDAAFKLGAGHARVPCAKCHPAKRDAKGTARVVYHPLASGCRDCHGPKRSEASDASS